MSRFPRIFIEGALFHITARGNQKQKIFFTTEDYKYYLALLKKAKMKYDVRLHAYCLMPNHIHLLVEPRTASAMSSFMHWVNRGYAAYFNMRYEKSGHLWQGRYRSKPIVKTRYLVVCVEYIESNPIRSGLVHSIDEYSWSSFRERISAGAPALLDEISGPGDALDICAGTGCIESLYPVQVKL